MMSELVQIHGGVDVFGSFEDWIDTFSIREMYDQRGSETVEDQPIEPVPGKKKTVEITEKINIYQLA